MDSRILFSVNSKWLKMVGGLESMEFYDLPNSWDEDPI